MSLRSPTEHENKDHRHAGMDGRHLGAQDASETSNVALDSSTPWNDATEGVLLKLNLNPSWTSPACASTQTGAVRGEP
jgi:hypothetical protein